MRYFIARIRDTMSICNRTEGESMLELVTLLCMIALMIWWWYAMQAREMAKQAAMHACEISSAHLLDDTVYLIKLWLRRSELGHVQICRFYLFDFTTNGEQRHYAYVLICGLRIKKVSMNIFDPLE